MSWLPELSDRRQRQVLGVVLLALAGLLVSALVSYREPVPGSPPLGRVQCVRSPGRLARTHLVRLARPARGVGRTPRRGSVRVESSARPRPPVHHRTNGGPLDSHDRGHCSDRSRGSECRRSLRSDRSGNRRPRGSVSPARPARPSSLALSSSLLCWSPPSSASTPSPWPGATSSANRRAPSAARSARGSRTDGRVCAPPRRRSR